MALWLVPVLALNAGVVRGRAACAALAGLLFFSALPFACLSMRRSLIGMELNAGNRPVEFISVFEPNPYKEITCSHDEARALEELSRSALKLRPSRVTLVRHGADPAVFPVMSALSHAPGKGPAFSFARPSSSHFGEDTVVVLSRAAAKPSPPGFTLVLENSYGSLWNSGRQLPGQ